MKPSARAIPGGRGTVRPSRDARFIRLGAGIRRLARALLVVAAALWLVKALFGERGSLDAWRARRQAAEIASSLDRLRRENAALRERARRLREDPRAVEAAARRDLGLRRPDEIVVIIRDAPPLADRRRRGSGEGWTAAPPGGRAER